MSKNGTVQGRVFPSWLSRVLPLSRMIWLGISLAIVLSAILLADEKLLGKSIQGSIGGESFKLVLQFLLITVAGGALLALINVRKDEDARREAQTEAIQKLDRELSAAYRSMKRSRRRLRSVVQSNQDRLRSKKHDFEACMDELLAAQLSLEEVEDNIETSSALFETRSLKRIKDVLYYAARYLHDVFQDFEQGRVKRERDSYIIGDDCKNLKDFLRGSKGDANFCKLATFYEDYKRIKSLEKKHEIFLKIDDRRRYQKIAFQCIRTASRELRTTSTLDASSSTLRGDYSADQAPPMNPDQALSLFKTYEDKGWAAKQQMITLVTWLTPVVFGLIAFSVKSHCDLSSTTTASVASVAALVMSLFMLCMIIGTLRHADQQYKIADNVIERNRHLVSEETYEIVSQGKKKESYPKLLFRLGFRQLGWVHIFIVYLAIFLVLVSAFLWLRPMTLTGLFCGSAETIPKIVS